MGVNPLLFVNDVNTPLRRLTTPGRAPRETLATALCGKITARRGWSTISATHIWPRAGAGPTFDTTACRDLVARRCRCTTASTLKITSSTVRGATTCRCQQMSSVPAASIQQTKWLSTAHREASSSFINSFTSRNIFRGRTTISD